MKIEFVVDGYKFFRFIVFNEEGLEKEMLTHSLRLFYNLKKFLCMDKIYTVCSLKTMYMQNAMLLVPRKFCAFAQKLHFFFVGLCNRCTVFVWMCYQFLMLQTLSSH